MSGQALILGAVAYDPKAVTIWDGFKEYFEARRLEFDYILFSNYERQVEAHFAGAIHVAWNSPLAWVRSERRAAALGRKAEAIAMRDTDRELTSLVVVGTDSAIHSVADLQGKRVAVGAKDSPQAALIPLGFLAQQGLNPGVDFEFVPFDGSWASMAITSAASGMRSARWWTAARMRLAFWTRTICCSGGTGPFLRARLAF
jgi:ABC-type phosphate/phosphonate transport system substrate-binding protein